MKTNLNFGLPTEIEWEYVARVGMDEDFLLSKLPDLLKPLESIPDETTICRFRHYLEAHNLTKKLFQVTEQCLSERGLILSEGTIVDASIISAPSSARRELMA